MSNPLHTDYLYLQQLIIDRLMSQMPPGQALPVEGAESMAQVFEADVRPMVVWVVWGGDRIDRSTAGPAALAYQGWLVLLAVRNPAPSKDARNNTAGTWLAMLHQALSGWQPAGVPGSPKFTRAQGPKPDYKKASALYPLAFEISIHF